jgi:hypothetical protein
MKRRAVSTRIALISALAFILLAAAQSGIHAESLTCHSPQQPRQIAQLLFGRDIGRKLGVSEAAWGRFVVREMTPRFPDGLTITEAIGQWRDPADGTIVLPDHDEDEARLAAIVTAYKLEFRQHSVIVIVRSACVSF